MLQVKDIVKYYGNHKAVDHLSFEVKEGEIFGLLGENGAGKTTTFRTIMGLIDATSGEVSLNGKKIDYNLTDQIGFVTEERSLLTKLTVKEQILYYGVLKGMDEDTIMVELEKWLKRFDIPDFMDRKIKELSKGNQQKIQFISAVIHRPKLLILDEPFSGLDPINVAMLKDAIYELQKEGCAIIFSSHQMEYIENFCEKLIILVHGKPVVDGYLKDVKKAYQKKTVLLKGQDLPIAAIKKIKGVVSVSKICDEYEVKIEKEEVAEKIFSIIKDSKVTKFDVAEPTLNEIFIEKVGVAHEA